MLHLPAFAKRLEIRHTDVSIFGQLERVRQRDDKERERPQEVPAQSFANRRRDFLENSSF